MVKSTGCAVLLLLVFVTATGCGSNPPEVGTGGKISNSELFQLVRSKLNGDVEISALKLSVDTNAEKNEVTLSGTVASEDLRNRALSLAQAARSGLAVKDAMTVTASQVTAKPEAKPKAKKSVSKTQAKNKPSKRRK